MSRIGPLQRQDCAQAAALSAVAFADAPGQQWSVDRLAAFLAQANTVAVAAYTDDELVGYALVQLAGPEAELLSIAVDVAARGQGLGGRLLAAAQQGAAQAGAEEILLEVAADNAPAAALYEKMGFCPAGRRANYYKNVLNQWVDAIVLRRALI